MRLLVFLVTVFAGCASGVWAQGFARICNSGTVSVSVATYHPGGVLSSNRASGFTVVDPGGCRSIELPAQRWMSFAFVGQDRNGRIGSFDFQFNTARRARNAPDSICVPQNGDSFSQGYGSRAEATIDCRAGFVPARTSLHLYADRVTSQNYPTIRLDVAPVGYNRFTPFPRADGGAPGLGALSADQLRSELARTQRELEELRTEVQAQRHALSRDCLGINPGSYAIGGLIASSVVRDFAEKTEARGGLPGLCYANGQAKGAMTLQPSEKAWVENQIALAEDMIISITETLQK